MSPVGWKPRAKQQFSVGRAILRSSRTVAGQFQIRSGMHPFGWKPRAIQQFSAGKKRFRSSRRTVAGKSEISQQQNGGGAVSIQIGHAPVRLEAQGQIAVQYRQIKISQQQKNSSRAVLTQIGHEPGRLEAQGLTVQCR